MQTYKQFCNKSNEFTEDSIQNIILGEMVLNELEFDSINEAELNESVKDILHKMGIHADKKAPGVIEYAAKFTHGVGRMVWAGMKADKKKIKEISKEFSKEALLDFLLKLDMLTLHAITGPIHMIDAATGWHIGAAIKSATKKAENAVEQIKKAIKVVKDKVTDVFAIKLQPRAISRLNDLEIMLDV